MSIREAIERAVGGGGLAEDEAAAVMEEIMTGAVTDAQLAAFLVALRMKGETVAEMAGMARVMREKAVPVMVEGPLLDTCGTGGDGSGSFNVSTAAAFVAAGAGARVAKHGNRALTSRCGSADVLEALGARIELTPERVARSVAEAGVGFMFAPSFHPAMRYAAGPRKEIGVRTVFNILGPLTNPAGAAYQLVGVPLRELGPKVAGVLARMGTKHALVVHGEEGIDEMSVTGPTFVWEVCGGTVEEHRIAPEDYGLRRVSASDIRGGTAEENAAIMRELLRGEGPAALRDFVLLNAAAALVAAELAPGLAEGMTKARDALGSGAAERALRRFVEVTNEP